VTQINDRLERIEDGLSTVLVKLALIDQRTTTAAEDHADHEQRIRQLERWRWSLPGAAAASAVAAVASLLAVVLHH
jgi:hypothetical protein